jgi:teichuronic acid biosynthesis glycosyltransferase TuaC
MKVLQVTNNYPTRKLPIFGIFVKEQIDSLIDLGIDTDFFFINGREKGPFEYIKSIFILALKLEKNNYDIVHCHHSFSALVLFLASLFKRKKNKYLVSFQSDPKNEFFGLFYYLFKFRFDGFIFKNKPNIKDKRSYYLPNGVNESFFRPIIKKRACEHLSLDYNNNYILFVSSNKFRKEKRFDLFKKVIKILQSNYPDFNFEMINMINVNRTEVPYFFNAASVHLLTSDFEGSPNSIKESIFCNTPVVSTNVGNVKDICEGLKGCFVSNSNDPKELADLVIKALNIDNFDCRDILIKKGYSIKNVASKLLTIYNEIKIK